MRAKIRAPKEQSILLLRQQNAFCKMKWSLTERFGQDPVEEYFVKQRKIGQRSDNPDICMLGYKNNTIQRFVSCQSGSN